MYLKNNFEQLTTILKNVDLACNEEPKISEGNTVESRVLEFLEKLPEQIKEILVFNKKVKKKLRTDYSPEWSTYKDWKVKFIPRKISNQTYIFKFENVGCGYNFKNSNTTSETLKLTTDKASGELVSMEFDALLNLKDTVINYNLELCAKDLLCSSVIVSKAGQIIKEKRARNLIAIKTNNSTVTLNAEDAKTDAPIA